MSSVPAIANARTESEASQVTDTQYVPHSPVVRSRHGLSNGLSGPFGSLQHMGSGAQALQDGLAPFKSNASDEHVTGATSKKDHPPPHAPQWAAPSIMQLPLLWLWNAACVAAIIHALQSMNPELQGLFYLYYQPLIPALFMLWLWGALVRYFEGRGIKYDVCFSTHDQRYLLPSRNILQVAGVLTALVLGSGAVFTQQCARERIDAAAYQPPLVYCCVLILALLPINILYKETRLFFSTTVYKIVTPFREVSWSDFLLADVLTSLAKALSDSERAVCHLITGDVMVTSERYCSGQSWLISAFLAAPYAWRFCQCIRVYLDTGARPQLFNALKYSTAFPLIILSATRFVVSKEDWYGFWKWWWLLAAFVNSAYSYYWDIERDWDIQWFTGPANETVCLGVKRPLLKPALLYDRAFYYYLIVSNLFLRLSWTYKLSPHLRRNQGTVLIFALLEVFRRFQWMPVRIEVELRKLQDQRPELGQLVPVPAKSAPLDPQRKALLAEADP